MTKKTTTKKVRNNLDIAMLLTDAILNTFEVSDSSYSCIIPLDEHKYSFELQDVIQVTLENIGGVE